MLEHEAEGVTALAVAEIAELFPHVTPERRAELMQRIRAPVLSAVLSMATLASRKRLRRRVSLEPSKN